MLNARTRSCARRWGILNSFMTLINETCTLENDRTWCRCTAADSANFDFRPKSSQLWRSIHHSSSIDMQKVNLRFNLAQLIFIADTTNEGEMKIRFFGANARIWVKHNITFINHFFSSPFVVNKFSECLNSSHVVETGREAGKTVFPVRNYRVSFPHANKSEIVVEKFVIKEWNRCCSMQRTWPLSRADECVIEKFNQR